MTPTKQGIIQGSYFMREMYLCLDVGGTQIKAAAVDREGNLKGELHYFPAKAKESREAILNHFADIMEDAVLRHKLNDLTQKTFGFDFENWVTGDILREITSPILLWNTEKSFLMFLPTGCSSYKTASQGNSFKSAP